MYHRIMNKLDAEILKMDLNSGSVDEAVWKRIRDIVAILDNEYGENRNSSDMGGYILFFGDVDAYEQTFPKITAFYHLDKDLNEYSECISNKQESCIEWWEELYLLSSDDALVFIYPKKISLTQKEEM